jgi:3-dehydroquinate dehydratase
MSITHPSVVNATIHLSADEVHALTVALGLDSFDVLAARFDSLDPDSLEDCVEAVDYITAHLPLARAVFPLHAAGTGGTITCDRATLVALLERVAADQRTVADDFDTSHDAGRRDYADTLRRAAKLTALRDRAAGV